MTILIDTGPIVAFLDKNEEHHRFVIDQMNRLQSPFYTCESVLSETFFLMQKLHSTSRGLLDLLEIGKIKVSFSYSRHASSVQEIMQTYANLPASFADACLLHMYETAPPAKVFTLDTHFNIYRTSKGKPLSLISPF